MTDLKVGQAVLTGKVERIENRLNSLEGNQKYQVWTLIVLLAGAIVKTFFLPCFMFYLSGIVSPQYE